MNFKPSARDTYVDQLPRIALVIEIRMKLLQYNLTRRWAEKWPAINGGEAMQMKLHEQEGKCVNDNKKTLPPETSGGVERNRKATMASCFFRMCSHILVT
jgi:hypothetical protein